MDSTRCRHPRDGELGGFDEARRRIRRRIVLVAATVLAATLSLGPVQARAATSPVEDLLAQCPSSAEIAAFDADLAITFEADTTAGTLVCHTSEGSADLTRFQERVYQALRVMKAIRYARSLPWTARNLYEWLVATIDGIRFRDDVGFSFCCDPPYVIDLEAIPNSEALFTNRWLDASDPIGLAGLVGLIVHEARHADGGPHTCGTNDETAGELGAWGAQYYLELWNALYSGAFLTPPDVYSSYYRDQHLRRAQSMLDRFCSLPEADLSLAIRDPSPSTAVRGEAITYEFAVTNSGPDAAPDVYLYSSVPEGTSFAGAITSQGSCTAADGGPIACSFGSIASGASVTARVSLLVDRASTVTEITNRQGPFAPGARVVGPYGDPTPDDASAYFTTPVAANRPPDCTRVTATPALLWPPDHELRKVTLSRAIDSDGDPVTPTVWYVSQDEDAGTGSTFPDTVQGDRPDTVLLRAERDGRGDGRTYTIGFSAADGKGGSCDGSISVFVPHDRRHGAVDDPR